MRRRNVPQLLAQVLFDHLDDAPAAKPPALLFDPVVHEQLVYIVLGKERYFGEALEQVFRNHIDNLPWLRADLDALEE